ncbi:MULTISPECIES: M3 family metallopeptidase [Prauserella salsuginis group]|uniref:M3 family metallopeptidase n=1 Tax=Prauserella salsuginis TaxID=387889 RepID=A0ABW6G4M8_9PSEU|nr:MULTISPECIES: M3 family metallopeptidase [Prauserella salsuginis group]MCR3718118.1 peptidyl-dipeptidase Dcp [Prauserella flava]MCR3732688.1 peptidyl-dipeptidase Dcp [Prauserella salsuginis]
MTDNPLLAPSDLPYGLPTFDRISDEHFLPAFEAAFAEHRAEIAAIADDPESPTFENTIVALECSGQLLHRVSQILFNLTAADSTDVRREVQTEVAPRLAAHSDEIHLNAALFARVDAVHAQREELDLTPEQDWLLHRTHIAFRRAGADLPEDKQTRLRELNEELSRLETRFQDNLLADTNDLAVLVSTRDELAGLSDGAIAAAAEAATARGEDGKYLLTLGLPSAQPVLASLENRELRKRVFRASVSRAGRGNEHDNKDVLATIARLRAERAAVLGYPHHAAYAIEDQTAGSADAAVAMLERLAPAAVANANAEAAELQEELTADGVEGDLQPWDWAYYAERVRKRKYDIDDAALRPYFELERVLVDGVFHAAGKLYGLTFTERPDLSGYHPDVRVWEVFDADGRPIGLYLGDYFTRDAKRGGAWMNNLVEQSRLLGQRPVVVNNLNITKPPEGESALLTYVEVTTLFHEFGHALHGLVSDVEYQSLEGTNVPRDFVEFPSQVNEMWALWPEVLANYARHHLTGEPLPQETASKLEEASRYGEGFRTTEYLAASLLDLAWHTLSPDADVTDVDRFEAEALEKAGVALATIPPRYRSTYFAHVFSNSYAAGYYSYIWSEVLDAESVEWFRASGGLTRENGDRFRTELLAKGGSVDVMEAFRAFRGRDPELRPLLERRGLTAA